MENWSFTTIKMFWIFSVQKDRNMYLWQRQELVGFRGHIEYDITKPDGMLRRIVDSSKINNLGWKAEISLKEGIEKTYK